jgi:type II secretory ATPase GspE/PulE/Tfp pilus assembly ATPase PilB-like protein
MTQNEFREAISSIFLRFSRLLSYQVPLLKAVETLCAENGLNDIVAALLQNIHRSLEYGMTFSGSLDRLGIFPDTLIAAVAAAENQGNLDPVMSIIAESVKAGDFILLIPESAEQLKKQKAEWDHCTVIPELLDRLISDAVTARASDLHLEPMPDSGRVRFRIDGVLHVQKQALTLDQHRAIISRLKTMANLDPGEQKLPQDGRSLVEIQTDACLKKMDLRISICPFTHGERGVIRFLDRSGFPKSLDVIDLPSETAATIRTWLKSPYGMIIASGPTGSGKTTTLYLMLQELAAVESINIMSIEDPVEYLLPGVFQMQVHAKFGLTFEAGLLSLLRQDPDVISVGEIRDSETAVLLGKVAQTGHLTLSQLHSADAVATVKLLYDFGLPDYVLHEILIGVISQRLVRKLCSACKTPDTEKRIVPKGLADKKITFYKPVGCEKCHQTGYLGRHIVMELFTPDHAFLKKLSQGADHDTLISALPASHVNLRQAGLQLVETGITTLAEIDRVFP